MTKLLIAFAILYAASAMADGPTNNYNPTINVNGCCAPKSCQAKSKVKVVTKIVVVEKQVFVPVEVEKPVYVDRTIVVEKPVVVVKRVHKKNRISLLGGMGPVKLDQVSPSQTNLNRGLVGGAMYQRSLNGSWNIGIQGQTNQTVLGVVGFDF